MEVKFISSQGPGIITIKDGEIKLDMNENTDIYEDFTKKIKNGFIELKDFKHKGIPGRFKSYTKPTSHEDILNLIKSVKRPFTIYNIVSTISTDRGYSIIEVENLASRKLAKIKEFIREFEEVYECCIIKDYEEKYKDLKIDIIQFDEVFIKVITVKEEKIILSINFPKDSFDLPKLIDWIKYNEIKNFSDKDTHIIGARKTYQGIRFRGNTILLYKKGPRDLIIDRKDLIEIKENIFNHGDKINIFHATSNEFNSPKTKIILDGKRIDYIPEIQIDEKSTLMCNGLIINAKYIGNYEDDIGFFKDSDSNELVSYIIGTTGPINIDNRETMVFVEYDVCLGVNDY